MFSMVILWTCLIFVCQFGALSSSTVLYDQCFVGCKQGCENPVELSEKQAIVCGKIDNTCMERCAKFAKSAEKLEDQYDEENISNELERRELHSEDSIENQYDEENESSEPRVQRELDLLSKLLKF